MPRRRFVVALLAVVALAACQPRTGCWPCAWGVCCAQAAPGGEP